MSSAEQAGSIFWAGVLLGACAMFGTIYYVLRAQRRAEASGYWTRSLTFHFDPTARVTFKALQTWMKAEKPVEVIRRSLAIADHVRDARTRGATVIFRFPGGAEQEFDPTSPPG